MPKEALRNSYLFITEFDFPSGTFSSEIFYRLISDIIYTFSFRSAEGLYSLILNKEIYNIDILPLNQNSSGTYNYIISTEKLQKVVTQKEVETYIKDSCDTDKPYHNVSINILCETNSEDDWGNFMKANQVFTNGFKEYIQEIHSDPDDFPECYCRVFGRLGDQIVHNCYSNGEFDEGYGFEAGQENEEEADIIVFENNRFNDSCMFNNDKYISLLKIIYDRNWSKNLSTESSSTSSDNNSIEKDNSNSTSGVLDKVSEIRALHKLYVDKILTKEEFEQEKIKILNR